MQTTPTLRGYKQLATYLGIGQESARQLMRRPGFPVVEISPRVRIILVEALEAWLRKQNTT